ncbi:haloacid dehalogenase type II [Methylobacterium isbiliense]|uniref:(S)-2-haloacid dehalogenase n=1 Tax=Methylobacterium isbiliense TaxID=315478 RepID=A0ABQ4S7W2_9HYPH|nr:haloacid dehalogenase type II [Methylobacterium isbiliense]MDN3623454.1 haloacid dehalogenase type II [Methylobacterium isbiliense]GJD99176.1 (S)-2-haloacid dehalogenase 4A [Methylobacterium isbiliense]
MPIQALIFDVFGTLLDWHGGVAREAERLLGTLRPDLDGGTFARAWRDRYQPGMEPIRAGARAYADLDVLHAESLEAVLASYRIDGVSPEAKQELVGAWHRLDAWPDVAEGLARLRPRFLLAPCSNAHVRLAIAHARRNGLPWDAVLGAEFARDYKPKPAVYLRTVEALRLEPGEVMMVAAHSFDLVAAAGCGLATAHIARPDESGPGTGEAAPACPVDVAARDLRDLADRLGC